MVPLTIAPLLLLPLALALTTLFETYTRPSQFVEVNGNKIFEGTERLFGDVCHIISLWPKVPLQRDESIIGRHLVLAVDGVTDEVSLG